MCVCVWGVGGGGICVYLYVCVCVRACVRTRESVCMRVRVYAGIHACVYLNTCERDCKEIYPSSLSSTFSAIQYLSSIIINFKSQPEYFPFAERTQSYPALFVLCAFREFFMYRGVFITKPFRPA